MPNSNHFVPGANNAFCMVCNKKVKSFEIKLRYDGVKCCQWCWTPRQPLDYPPHIRPEIPPAIISPEPPGIFDVYCELYRRQMVPGIVWPGCGFPGWYVGIGDTPHVEPVLVENPEIVTYD